jgi:hypothetical protein
MDICLISGLYSMKSGKKNLKKNGVPKMVYLTQIFYFPYKATHTFKNNPLKKHTFLKTIS